MRSAMMSSAFHCSVYWLHEHHVQGVEHRPLHVPVEVVGHQVRRLKLSAREARQTGGDLGPVVGGNADVHHGPAVLDGFFFMVWSPGEQVFGPPCRAGQPAGAGHGNSIASDPPRGAVQLQKPFSSDWQNDRLTHRRIQEHHHHETGHQAEGGAGLVAVAVGLGITSWDTTKIIAPAASPSPTG